MIIQKIVRQCPNPALISAYLRETCQVVKDVTETSPVCFSYLRIAKVKSNSDMMSKNDGIKQLRRELSGQEISVVGDDIDTIIEKALLQTRVWLLDALLEIASFVSGCTRPLLFCLFISEYTI